MDPEYRRLKRKYPTFPGVQSYLIELRRGNIRGGYLECMVGDLADHAGAHLDELLQVYEAEPDGWIKRVLFSVIVEVPAAPTMPILQHALQSPDSLLRSLAMHQLKMLNTKEARSLLWQARTYTFPTPEETQDVRNELDR